MYFGSYTLIVTAETEHERDNKLEILYQELLELDSEDINDFENTEDTWSS